MARLGFLFKTIGRMAMLQPRTCPFCGHAQTELLQRKKVLLELRRCTQCHLKFRYPKDHIEESRKFYQKTYDEGRTTEVPSKDELQRLLSTKFACTENDRQRDIAMLSELVPRGRVLDFGCSWGYATWQLNQAGFIAEGFEISKPRAAYARRHLEANVYDDYDQLHTLLPGTFDAIYTSHVLEHLPELHGAFSAFARLLKPAGILLVVVPNAGGDIARQLGTKWGPLIGEKHSLALDAVFFAHNLPKYGIDPCFCTFPGPSQLVNSSQVKDLSLSLPGWELVVIGRKVSIPR